MTIQETKIGISILFLTMLIMLTSCDFLGDDEPTDKKEIVTLYVSSETGTMSGLTGVEHECMLVKEKEQTSWNPWEFEGINGFIYEKGFDYELLVTKTIYANPPADGGTYSYELIREVSKNSPDTTLCKFTIVGLSKTMNIYNILCCTFKQERLESTIIPQTELDKRRGSRKAI